MESWDTESNAALKLMKAMQAYLLNSFDFSMILTNCETLFGCTSPSCETSMFTTAVVVLGWSDALRKDHGKQLSGDGE